MNPVEPATSPCTWVVYLDGVALFHGHAHGTEMASGSSGLAYALGFAGATALLHATGIGLGVFLSHKAKENWLRAAGAGIAFCGIILAFN